MTEKDLTAILYRLLAQQVEDEIVEFKEAKNGYDFNKLGKYFSALSNEANLKGKEFAWLVMGVKDVDHSIVGSQFRSYRPDLDNIKKEIADKMSNRITFHEIYELNMQTGRVVMFQIPAASTGIPVSFDGHFYGRDGESLVALSLEEIERIRVQNRVVDWSSEIIESATLDDLDPEAIGKARIEYLKRHPAQFDNLTEWDNKKFLDKARITIRGKITRTALILLGKEESLHLLSPAVTQIRWNLRSIDNQDKDFEIFHGPLILAVDKVYGKIRNLKYRYLQEGTLFPDEVLRYDPYTIRELLNNCIAHQDYTKGGMINVTEFEDDHLIFSNKGSFIPRTVEIAVLRDTPEEFYRNRFMVDAMRNLGMIETQGGGIRKVFNIQKDRLFPLPDYDLSDGKVKVNVIGKVLDIKFARILLAHPGISLQDVMLLDKIQKKLSIPKESILYLKQKKLIEGRKPNLYLSEGVVAGTNNATLKAQYIKNRSLGDDHCKQMILKYIRQYGKASRKDLNALILDKLSDALDEKQKTKKLSNLLSDLRRSGKIRADAEKTWKLV